MSVKGKITDDPVAVSNLRELRRLRLKKGLDQKDIAAKIGFSSSTISRAEIYPEEIRIPVYNALARYFGWTLYKGSHEDMQRTIFDVPSSPADIQPNVNAKSIEVSGEILSKLEALSVIRGEKVSDLVSELLSGYLDKISAVGL